MISLNNEQQNAVSSLKGNHNFYKIVELLAEEQQFCIKGLMTAKVETIGRLQGRTKLLEELLSLFR